MNAQAGIVDPRATFAAAQQDLSRGRFGPARAALQSLLDAGHDVHAVRVNLAQACKRLGDWDAAMEHFEAGFRLSRLSGHAQVAPIGWFYLHHLGEQLDHLDALGRPAATPQQRAEVERAASFLRDAYGPNRPGPLPDFLGQGTRELIFGCANPLRPEAIPGAVNADVRVDTIDLGEQHAFVMDDLLTPDALAALRRFLTEATLFYDARPERGYLGAHLHDGLAGPFLRGLIEEIRALMERLVAQPVQMAQVWAFKYEHEAPGIDLHADQASWNLNLWPTDEAANADPEAGGLRLTHFRVPDDWPFERYNATPDANRRELEERGVGATRVAYRGNRAVLFPSRYLHQTEPVRFRGRYAERRINMTFMADIIESRERS